METKFSSEQVETLKESALAFGVSADVIANYLEKYGPKALSMVVEGLRYGLTLSFIMELMSVFGPAVLDLLLAVLGQSKMSSADGAETTCEISTSCENMGFIGQGIITVLLVKYLPILLARYGPEVIGIVFDWLSKVLKKPQPVTN